MYKKIITLFISVAMSLLLCAGVSADESYDGYLYFTVERITLGQGFAVEPTKVGYYEEDTLFEVIDRLLQRQYETNYTPDYISGIKDGGEPEGWTENDIPKPIREKLTSVGKRNTDEFLGETDYSSQAGWNISVDNVASPVGAGSVKFGDDSSDGKHYEDNSVVRLMFTLYGYGVDVGAYGTEFADVNTFADKSALIKKVADINYANEQADYGESYIAAMAVLEDWDATATEIENAVNSLRKPVKIAKSETDTQITLDVETNGKADIYVAFYNSDFTLKSVKVYNLSASDTIECTKETDNYRIFVWDDMLPQESEIK